jgi:predicted DNA repair protein MutK
MSGLLALFDDVAAIAKVAAASLDDVAAQAAKAGAKAAGAVIDDAAVTPKYVQGFSAERELPIVWRIAKGSIKNKLLFLLPAALLLSTFAPWAISPLLMLGGAYLCFEGAEKIWHVLRRSTGHHSNDHQKTSSHQSDDPAHLEEQRAKGAIKTDFILSAEIMTIALAAIPESNIWFMAATLALVGIGITVVVYGSVALIVKADDVGLYMARNGELALTRGLGRGLVQAMPAVMTLLMVVGTAAMLWVGGSIVIHGLEQFGVTVVGHHIHDLAHWVAHHASDSFAGFVAWLIKAMLDGVFGLVLGFGLIALTKRVFTPIFAAIKPNFE